MSFREGHFLAAVPQFTATATLGIWTEQGCNSLHMWTMAAGTIDLRLGVSTSLFCLIFPNDGTLQPAEVTLHARLQYLPV